MKSVDRKAVSQAVGVVLFIVAAALTVSLAPASADEGDLLLCRAGTGDGTFFIYKDGVDDCGDISNLVDFNGNTIDVGEWIPPYGENKDCDVFTENHDLQVREGNVCDRMMVGVAYKWNHIRNVFDFAFVPEPGAETLADYGFIPY